MNHTKITELKYGQSIKAKSDLNSYRSHHWHKKTHEHVPASCELLEEKRPMAKEIHFKNEAEF